MLTYAAVLRRSLTISVALAGADSIVGLLSRIAFDFSFIGVTGDLMLIEVAALFVVAGLLDFGSSVGMAQFRKLILSSKEEYSSTKRKETERSAMVFLFAGLILLTAIILLTMYDLSSTRI